jgi:hypothetical protein
MRSAHAAFTMNLVGETDFTLLVLPSDAYASDDRISVTVDGAPVAWRIRPAAHDTRELVFTAPAGALAVEVDTSVDALQRPIDEGDAARYLDDSRYVEASALRGFVDERFGRVSGFEQIAAMRQWIARGFTYSPALSVIDDSAVSTLEKRGGMCRDYTHVMIAMADLNKADGADTTAVQRIRKSAQQRVGIVAVVIDEGGKRGRQIGHGARPCGGGNEKSNGACRRSAAVRNAVIARSARNDGRCISRAVSSRSRRSPCPDSGRRRVRWPRAGGCRHRR